VGLGGSHCGVAICARFEVCCSLDPVACGAGFVDLVDLGFKALMASFSAVRFFWLLLRFRAARAAFMVVQGASSAFCSAIRLAMAWSSVMAVSPWVVASACGASVITFALVPMLINRNRSKNRDLNTWPTTLKSRPSNTLSVGQVAQFCDRSTQWIQQRTKEGFIVKEAHGRYKLVSVVRGVIAYYEDLQAKNKQVCRSKPRDRRPDPGD